MDKYNSLLRTVAQKYHICKGIQETDENWKARLVYSICGMMGYASLWNADGEPISIVDWKRKVLTMVENYKSMYPELSGNLTSSEKLRDEVARLFLNNGIVYHSPYRIVPSMRREVPFRSIVFQRGIALDNISCVSGIGFYSNREGAPATESAVNEMFGLEHESLKTQWLSTLSTASWKTGISFEQNTEYLRLKPPFSQGYWVNKPDTTTGTVSILRTGMNGARLYYLYRYSDTVVEVSPIPQWKVGTLACALLSSYGTLPPIEYFEDGSLVHIRMNYLLPPRELEFLKLYSWPENCSSLPCDFKRKLSKEVFTSIMKILSDEGYVFKEGKI